MPKITLDKCNNCRGTGVVQIKDYDVEIWQSVRAHLIQNIKGLTEKRLDKYLLYLYPQYRPNVCFTFLLDMQHSIFKSSLMRELKRMSETYGDTLPPKPGTEDYVTAYANKTTTYLKAV